MQTADAKHTQPAGQKARERIQTMSKKTLALCSNNEVIAYASLNQARAAHAAASAIRQANVDEHRCLAGFCRFVLTWF
jgi:hypothetical protein